MGTVRAFSFCGLFSSIMATDPLFLTLTSSELAGRLEKDRAVEHKGTLLENVAIPAAMRRDSTINRFMLKNATRVGSCNSKGCLGYVLMWKSLAQALR